MITLRPYQEDNINEIRLNFRRKVMSVLYQLPTGGGKTTSTSAMFANGSAKGNSLAFICHRRELLDQVAGAMDQFGLEYGFIAAGYTPNPFAKIQICSIQTLAARLDRIKFKPKVCVWDETHHIAAGQWATVRRHFQDSYHIGLTATPERLDGKGLGAFYDVMVRGPSVQQLIDMGYLCQPRVFAPSKVDLSAVHTVAGDYAKDEIADLMDKPTITGDAIQHYRQYANGKRAVIFCISRVHSRNVVEQFNANGIRAEHVDGETDKDERRAAIERFRRGETLVLSNVDLFGEGFDLPAIEVSILLRPTKSLSMYLQQCGRALRTVYKPGMPLTTDAERKAAIAASDKPHAIILDHAGNALLHGLPQQDREWSLAGRAKKKGKQKDNGPPVRQCPDCFFVGPAAMRVCPSCGHTFMVNSREVDQVDGHLTEITTEANNLQIKPVKRKANPTFKATYDNLVQYAISKGYAKPHAWAWLQIKAKQKKKASPHVGSENPE